MKARIYIAASLLVFLGISSLAEASNYYVSPNGADTNPGTIDLPKLSLSTSVSLLNPGDTLFARGGIYIQRLVSSKSGTSEKPIVITAYMNEKPVIDGDSTLASNWGSMVNLTGSFVHLNGFEIRRGLGVGVNLGGSNNKMSNCNIHHHAERGVSVNGNNNIVEYCEVWWNAWYNCRLPGWPASKYPTGGWGTGLSAMRYPTGTILRRNLVHENWGEGVSSFEASSTTIEDNIIYNNFSINLYISDTRNTIAQRNIIYNDPAILPLAAGIGICDERGRISGSTDNSRSSDNIIINNLVFGCKSNISWWADSRTPNPGMTNILVANNTFVNGTEKNISINSTRTHQNIRFINNIVLQENTNSIITFSSSGFTFSNNLWSKTPVSSVSGTGDRIGNPMISKTGLTGAGQLTFEYFRIAENSPAIGAGQVLTEVPGDFFKSVRGTTTDIGAIEFAGTNSIVSNSLKTMPLTIFPNPVKGSALVSFELNSPGEVFLSVYDMQGKVLERKSGFFSRGVNYWELTICEKYQKGVFQVRLLNEEILFSGKLMVL